MQEAKPTIKAAHACIHSYLGDALAAAKHLKKNRSPSKAMHEFRVAARRTMTCLDIYESFLDDRFKKRMSRDINSLRKKCGKVRDREVFLKTLVNLSDKLTEPELLAAYDVARRTRKELKHHELRVRKTLSVKAIKKLGRRSDDYFINSAITAQASGKLTEFAPLVIARELKDVYKLYEADSHDESYETIHSLRRQFKKLRYALDSLKAHAPHSMPQELQATLVEAQDILGYLADLDMSFNQVTKHARRAKSQRGERPLGYALLAARLTTLLERQHDIFLAFWHAKIGEEYGYEMLKAWGLRDSTARWVLGRANIVSLHKPKAPRSTQKPAAVMGK